MLHERGRWRIVLLGLMLTSGTGSATEDGALRLASGLAAPAPEVLQTGRCVRYEEGGAGLLGRSPPFWLEGEVVSFRREQRPWRACPEDWRTQARPQDRDALLARERQLPCGFADEATPAPFEVVWVKLRPRRWETPWARAWASKGRLYRGLYLDEPLRPEAELEIDARLLFACRPESP